MAKTFFKKTFVEFFNHLNEHSIATATRFVSIKAPKSFSVEKVSPTKTQKLYWKHGTPYFFFGSKTYQCQHGKDMNLKAKKKYAEERDKRAMMDHSVIKRYNSKKMSKKLNCPASINVSRVIWIPEYKLSGLLSERYEQSKILQLIRSRVENGESVGEECFMYNLPTIEEHSNHPVDVTEPVDSRVRDYIRQLVRRGERNTAVVSKLLETFVEGELHQTNRHRRRFYPNLDEVRRIITAEKSKLAKNPTDQENTEVLMQLISDPVFNQIEVLEVVNIEEVSNGSGPDNTEDNEGRTPENQEISSNRRHLVNECCSTLRSLQSILEYLDESDLNTLNNTMKDLYQRISCKVSAEIISCLPVEAETQVSLTS